MKRRIMKEVLKRVLGYFGRDKNRSAGPTVLGMETKSHRDVPNADEIKKAVQEAKETLSNKKK